MLNLVNNFAILSQSAARNRCLHVTVRLHLHLMVLHRGLIHFIILDDLLSISFLLLRDPLHLVDELTLAQVLVVSLGLPILTSWLIKFILFINDA